MNLKKYLDYRLLGLIGSILLILSQFIPWYSNRSLLDILIIIPIDLAFIYLFPLISGIICSIGTIIIIINSEYRINSVIINFIGLGFFLFFAFRIIPEDLIYLPNALGFYFSIIGSILVFFDILNILLTREK